METNQTQETVAPTIPFLIKDVVIKLNHIAREALLTRFKPEQNLVELLNTKPSDLHKLGKFGLRSYKALIEILGRTYPESKSFPVYDLDDFLKK